MGNYAHGKYLAGAKQLLCPLSCHALRSAAHSASCHCLMSCECSHSVLFFSFVACGFSCHINRSGQRCHVCHVFHSVTSGDAFLVTPRHCKCGCIAHLVRPTRLFPIAPDNRWSRIIQENLRPAGALLVVCATEPSPRTRAALRYGRNPMDTMQGLTTEYSTTVAREQKPQACREAQTQTEMETQAKGQPDKETEARVQSMERAQRRLGGRYQLQECVGAGSYGESKRQRE